MKTNLIRWAVAATALTSFGALASDWEDDDDDDHDDVEVSIGWNQPPCDPLGTPVGGPPSPPSPGGHYELRDTRKWIPARYEHVTVRQCFETHGHGHHRRGHRCVPVTETRLVPGYFQTVQEWVWVPTYPRQQYSRYPAHRPPLYGQARLGFQVNIP